MDAGARLVDVARALAVRRRRSQPASVSEVAESNLVAKRRVVTTSKASAGKVLLRNREKRPEHHLLTIKILLVMMAPQLFLCPSLEV